MAAASAPSASFGMAKGKKTNVADSNISLLGSKVEKDVKAASAGVEKAWDKAGKKVGLELWRIENFKVVAVRDNIGSFFSGDSYIVLNTYKNPGSEALRWDLHFWLGSETSQDEAGTAAYKTVELDTHLGGGPVQHRELEGCESELFLSYFVGGVKILAGGVDSGFKHVSPETYKPRLLWLKGKKNVRVVEVNRKFSSMNHGDVFLLDTGLTIFKWIGSEAGKMEINRSRDICDALRAERSGKASIVNINEGDRDAGTMYLHLEGSPADIKSAAEGGDDAAIEKSKIAVKRLYRFSDASGQDEFTLVAEGSIKRSLVTSDDVFIFDIGSEVFAFVGNNASANEKAMAIRFAQEYCVKYERPNWLPIARIMENSQNKLFDSSFDS